MGDKGPRISRSLYCITTGKQNSVTILQVIRGYALLSKIYG